MEITSLASLTEEELCALHNDFFADYSVPIVLSPQIFHNNNVRRSVSYALSVGAFIENRCVGFVLVGDGYWQGKKTAYDAGTAVSPIFRGKGVSKHMMKILLEQLREKQYELFLLEVICSNEPAIGLYQKTGFVVSRKLNCYQGQVSETILCAPTPDDIHLQDLKKTDSQLFASFCDSSPSWQNSTTSIDALAEPHLLIGAFSQSDNSCLGYVAARSSNERVEIIQLAVSPQHRCRGIGMALLKRICENSTSGAIIRVVNVDESNLSAHRFMTRTAGFDLGLTQFEMIREL